MNNNQNRDLGWRFETDRDQGRERGSGPERGWGGVGWGLGDWRYQMLIVIIWLVTWIPFIDEANLLKTNFVPELQQKTGK